MLTLAEQRRRLIYLVTFLMDLSYGLFLLAASLKAVAVLERPFLLGLTGTFHVLTRIAANVLFGHLSDRVGRLPLLLFSSFLMAFSFALLPLFGSAASIFLLYIISGLAMAIFWPVLEAFLGDHSPGEDLVHSIGHFGIAFTLGMTLGPFLGGWLETFGPLAAAATGLLFMAAAVGAILAAAKAKAPAKKKEPGAERPQGANIQRQRPGRQADDLQEKRTKRTEAFTHMGWLANLAMWVAIGIIRFLFPKLGLTLGLKPLEIGLTLAGFYLSWCLTFAVLTKWQSWLYDTRVLFGSQLLGAAAFTAMWVLSGPLALALLMPLAAVAAGVCYFSSLYYCQEGHERRGRQTGMHEMFLGMGQLLGPFIGGWVAEISSLQAPFLVCSTALLLAVPAEKALYTMRMPGTTAEGTHAGT